MVSGEERKILVSENGRKQMLLLEMSMPPEYQKCELQGALKLFGHAVLVTVISPLAVHTPYCFCSSVDIKPLFNGNESISHYDTVLCYSNVILPQNTVLDTCSA